MGLACYTGRHGFFDLYKREKLVFNFYKHQAKLFLTPRISAQYFDALKMHLALDLVLTNTHKTRKKALKKIISRLGTKLMSFDPDRVEMLKRAHDILEEEFKRKKSLGGRIKKYKEIYKALDLLDKAYEVGKWEAGEYTHWVDKDTKEFKIFADRIRRKFHKELALVDVPDDVRRSLALELEEAIRKAQLGDFKHLDDLIDRVHVLHEVEKLPHLSLKSWTWAGVMSAWSILMLQASAQDYQDYWKYIHDDYVRRYGEEPPQSLLGALSQAVVGKTTALSEFMYYLYIEKDRVLQENQKWHIWNDTQLTAYYITKNIILPAVGESISGIVEEKVIANLSVKFLQKLALKGGFWTRLLNVVMSGGVRMALARGLFSMALAFAGGFIVEGALAIAFAWLVGKTFWEEYKERVQAWKEFLEQLRRLERFKKEFEHALEEALKEYTRAKYSFEASFTNIGKGEYRIDYLTGFEGYGVITASANGIFASTYLAERFARWKTKEVRLKKEAEKAKREITMLFNTILRKKTAIGAPIIALYDQDYEDSQTFYDDVIDGVALCDDCNDWGDIPEWFFQDGGAVLKIHANAEGAVFWGGLYIPAYEEIPGYTEPMRTIILESIRNITRQTLRSGKRLEGLLNPRLAFGEWITSAVYLAIKIFRKIGDWSGESIFEEINTQDTVIEDTRVLRSYYADAYEKKFFNCISCGSDLVVGVEVFRNPTQFSLGDIRASRWGDKSIKIELPYFSEVLIVGGQQRGHKTYKTFYKVVGRAKYKSAGFSHLRVILEFKDDQEREDFIKKATKRDVRKKLRDGIKEILPRRRQPTQRTNPWMRFMPQAGLLPFLNRLDAITRFYFVAQIIQSS